MVKIKAYLTKIGIFFPQHYESILTSQVGLVEDNFDWSTMILPSHGLPLNPTLDLLQNCFLNCAVMTQCNVGTFFHSIHPGLLSILSVLYFCIS